MISQGYSQSIVMAMQGTKFGDEDYARLTGNPLMNGGSDDIPSSPGTEEKANDEPRRNGLTPRAGRPEVTIPIFPTVPWNGPGALEMARW